MSLDLTDAEAVRARCWSWSPGNGEIGYSTLLYQMGGRRGVDPYGWQRERIDAAIETGTHSGLLKVVERATGAHIAAARYEQPRTGHRPEPGAG